MYLLYVDESGVEQKEGGTSHFVLLGLAVRADHWRNLDSKINNLKEQYNLKGAEIHTAWMLREYVEQGGGGFEKLSQDDRRIAAEERMKARAGVLGIQGNKKTIKNYRKYWRNVEPYIHLTHSERKQCLEAMADEVGRSGTTRIIAEAISKEDFDYSKPSTPYEWAFEQILTRFDYMLTNYNKMGIVIQDNNQTVAPRLTRLTRQFYLFGTFFRQIKNIVETPLFVDSTLTSMIQMADLSVYALRRFIEKGEENLWSRVEPRGDKIGTTLVGLRHYTGSRPCSCPICIAHGRQ